MQTNPSLSRQAGRNAFYCMEGRCGSRLRLPARFGTGSFSLIEVVIALGVVAFAFVALFGMLPVGLNAFNNSIDATTETQIAQNVISQLKQAKFSTLYTVYNDSNSGQNTSPAGAPSFFKPYTQRYPTPATGFFYDDQGRFLAFIQQGSTQNTPPANYVYTAAVQVYYNSWTILPGQATTPPFGMPPTTMSGSNVSSSLNTQSPQPFATVVITISKLSSPNSARIYTCYIDNNGF